MQIDQGGVSVLGQKAQLEPGEALVDFKPLKTGDRNQNSIDFQCAYTNMSKPNKT